MAKNTTPPLLTEADVAALAGAAGITLSGSRLEITANLANRFRGSVDVIRAYLGERGDAAGKAEQS